MSTVKVGEFNLMRVDRKVDFGFYMDDGEEGILLPKRFVPSGLQVGDTISDSYIVTGKQIGRASCRERV